ncbi:hypothetical protein SEA_ABT2GRADUATEX2_27 [Streptomyces phage Abt2graduatex2]|nr:hypothetical protein SEA_ABT2GRADUATEX2_27 [Streptomyces phage Abt2graduatex2]
MGRCGCGSDQQCLSTNPGNLASYDDTGCLYVAEFEPLFNAANQVGNVDLVPPASGAWLDTGLSLTIPAAGTFEVVFDAYTVLHVNIAADGGSAQIQAHVRLWNETASALVPNTQVVGNSSGSNRGGRYLSSAGCTVHTNLVTTGPTQLKLQVMRMDFSSGAAIVTPLSLTALRAEGTSLRYKRIA